MTNYIHEARLEWEPIPQGPRVARFCEYRGGPDVVVYDQGRGWRFADSGLAVSAEKATELELRLQRSSLMENDPLIYSQILRVDSLQGLQQFEGSELRLAQSAGGPGEVVYLSSSIEEAADRSDPPLAWILFGVLMAFLGAEIGSRFGFPLLPF